MLGPFSKGLVHRDRPIPRRTFVSRSLLSQSSFCQSSLQQDSSYHTSLASCIGLIVLELLTLVFYAGILALEFSTSWFCRPGSFYWGFLFLKSETECFTIRAPHWNIPLKLTIFVLVILSVFKAFS